MHFNIVIREWRESGGLQTGMLSNSQPVHDPMPSSTVSASRKKQKTSQSVASLSVGVPSPVLHTSLRPSSSALKRVGRKVWTRWPEDNNFYEAVITDYNPVEGRHALVYDSSTTDKTWE
ncbi:hypothetical protein CsSME_00023859 [Camellia sinensis var. sinensis]